MTEVKNLCWGSLSLFLILLSFSFTHWCVSHHNNQKALVKEKNDKRAQLDKYYESEFYCNYCSANSCTVDTDRSIRQIIRDERDEIKNNMLTDGYDRAEINDISTKAYRDAHEILVERIREEKANTR
jgi:hypothetical protein